MKDNDLDRLFHAAKSGDEKTAAELGGKMKESLSEDKKKMLERALTDNDYLKQLLSSEKARRVMDGLKRKGND
ncbi:MAG: hypothetical protein IJK89_06235 [Clostridia bacterium]|nr:hypothetical protein [Clostridia bacterium]